MPALGFGNVVAFIGLQVRPPSCDHDSAITD